MVWTHFNTLSTVDVIYGSMTAMYCWQLMLIYAFIWVFNSCWHSFVYFSNI